MKKLILFLTISFLYSADLPDICDVPSSYVIESCSTPGGGRSHDLYENAKDKYPDCVVRSDKQDKKRIDYIYKYLGERYENSDHDDMVNIESKVYECKYHVEESDEPDDNSTQPDDNSTQPDDNATEPQECPINSSYSVFTKKCECNNGYYESNDGCVPDPCTNPNQHYDVDANRCLCNEGYSSATYDLTGDGSGLNCQENNNNDSNDTSNDPCEYPSTKDGFSYHGKFMDYQVCMDDIKNFGCSNGTAFKNDDCSFGACYYNTTDNCPNNDGDDNNTSNSDDKESDIPTDENNSKITDADNNISLDITPITKALNTLDTSIKTGSSNIVDAIHQNTKSLGDKISALDSTVQSGLNRLHNDLTAPSHIPAVSGIQIDNSKVSDITSKVSDIKNKLSESSSLLENAISEYTSFVSNVTESFNTLKENLTSYQDMFSNKPTVNISSGGSCNLQVNVFGKTVDFGSGLDSALLQIAPLFKFFMTVITQVFLILISIKFFTKD